MNTEPPPTRSERETAFGLALLLCFGVLLGVLFLFVLDAQPFPFLLVMTLGTIVGMIDARRRYPAWRQVVRANILGRTTGRHIGVSFLVSLLSIFIFIVIMSLLADRWKSIFSSAVFGAVTGYLIGYFLWLVGLYLNRNKSESIP